MKRILAILVVATLSGCASVEWFPSANSTSWINSLPATAAGPTSEPANMQVADASDPCAGKRMSKIRCKW